MFPEVGRNGWRRARKEVQSREATREALVRSRCVLVVVGCIAILGCRDGNFGATSALAPNQAALYARASSADSAWDTYAAVVTVNDGRSAVSGIGDQTMQFRLTRSYQSDSAWHAIIEPLARRGQAPLRPVQERERLARVEEGPQGTRAFNGLGLEIKPRDLALPDQSSAVAQHPEWPRLASLPNPPAHRQGGGHKAENRQAWADQMFAGSNAGARARERYARQFGAAERKGAQLRYVRLRGDEQLELLADSLTGMPDEITKRNHGIVQYRVTNLYDHRDDGSAILKQTSVERADASGAIVAKITTKFDSVVFSRGGH